MSFDPVPWAVSGSQLDAYVMRALANIATRDSQGIQLPGNCKVTATASPSNQITIAQGGTVIRNRSVSGQTYVGHVASDTLVPVAPTGGLARSDLVIATIRDGDFSPWMPYTDPNAILFGPYFYPEIISGVSGSTTLASTVVSYSALELARIDLPPGTTNITNAMITDLRSLSQARYAPAYDVQAVTSTQSILTTDTTFKDWPTNNLVVKVPTWATHAQTVITINGIRADDDGRANVRVNFGGITGPSSLFDFVRPEWCNDYVSLLFQAYSEVNVQSLQGQSVIVKPQGQRGSPVGVGHINVDNRQQVQFDVQFSERVV